MSSALNWFRISSLLCFITYELIACPALRAQDTPIVPCNNIVYIRSKELKDYFSFTKSPLNSTAKVTVSYCSINGSTFSEELPYETLWYADYQPLGCRRYRDLDILPLHRVYVYINAAEGAAGRAAVNALVRLIFDLTLNRDSVVAVEVPADSFSFFVDAMARENFYIPSRLNTFAGQGSVYITLIDSVGDTKIMLYSGYQ